MIKVLNQNFKKLKITDVEWSGKGKCVGSYRSTHIGHSFTTEGPVITAFDKTLKKIISAIAENYRGNLRGFLELTYEEGSFEDELIQRTYFLAIENIQNRKDNKGIIYEIKNDKGATHYLAGTVHLGNKWMMENKKLNECIQKSDLIFVETLDNKFLGAHVINYYLGLSKMGYLMDMHMVWTFASSYRNRGLTGTRIWKLEEVEYQKEILIEEGLDEKVTKKLVKEISNGSRESALFYLLMEAWQNGDEKTLELYCQQFKDKNEKAYNSMIVNRNINWLNGTKVSCNIGLENAVKQNEEICCIGVGVLHCIGENGLVEGFKKAGLTVKKMD